MIISNTTQGTQEWHDEKLCKIGSTRLTKILTPAKLELSSQRESIKYALVDENFTGMSSNSDYISPEMERGNELEPRARV